MTKKDFELIANIIKTFEPPFATMNQTIEDDEEQTEYTRNALADTFAKHLTSTNPFFNREKFLKACGIVED